MKIFLIEADAPPWTYLQKPLKSVFIINRVTIDKVPLRHVVSPGLLEETYIVMCHIYTANRLKMTTVTRLVVCG